MPMFLKTPGGGSKTYGYSVPDPRGGGGQKGHMPPRSDYKAYLAPREKVNF